MINNYFKCIMLIPRGRGLDITFEKRVHIQPFDGSDGRGIFLAWQLLEDQMRGLPKGSYRQYSVWEALLMRGPWASLEAIKPRRPVLQLVLEPDDYTTN